VAEERDSGVGTCSLLGGTLNKSSVIRFDANEETRSPSITSRGILFMTSVSSVKSSLLRNVKVFQISSSPLEGSIPGSGLSQEVMLTLVLLSRLSNDASVQRDFK
jgi:hypothetical protein